MKFKKFYKLVTHNHKRLIVYMIFGVAFGVLLLRHIDCVFVYEENKIYMTFSKRGFIIGYEKCNPGYIGNRIDGLFVEDYSGGWAMSAYDHHFDINWFSRCFAYIGEPDIDSAYSNRFICVISSTFVLIIFICFYIHGFSKNCIAFRKTDDCCSKCGYCLKHSSSKTCPECGLEHCT